MSTFSRPLPARVRSGGGDAPDPSQAIIAASAPSSRKGNRCTSGEAFSHSMGRFRRGRQIRHRRFNELKAKRLIRSTDQKPTAIPVTLAQVYRPQFLRHRIEAYAARAADGSWLCRTAFGV